PYWSQADASQRALLDARLCDLLPPRFTRTQLQVVLQKNAPERIKQEFNALWQNPLPAQRPSAWAKTWAHVLAVWPGTRSLDSYEVQVQKAWQKALETLAALDVLERDYSAAGALAVTRRICQNQLFQVQSSPDAALQILGLREPLSAPVDALWVLGMNDDILPPAPRPNPLLPYALQRQFALPNADSKVQAQLAARIFARLQVSAEQVIFSYSQMEDTRELLPSPLLANLPCLSETPAPALTQAETLAQQPKPSLQALLDTQAPTIDTGLAVAGGVGSLQAQAVCPAWAFYRYRLAARPLHQPELGIDALTRGNLVHQVLADFWRQCSFANLADLSPSALQTTVQALAQTAVHRCSPHRPYPQRLLELEVVALTERICAWLDFERGQPFRAVLSVEEKRQALLADIAFSFKPDRIHVLEDGSRVVVDYKTGSLPSLASWASPRLLEPQLPFYALFAAPDLEG
ncbi:MAG: PD-(D/E)XK nuclease family protein, partial [Methylophilaceae bacterium]|nr:PD-(D/E)XK nuclease family protein [Methylophilaceae bacterium]